MKIKHQLSIATLVLAGVFATGCSQQQAAGGNQVAGGSQQQVEGGNQVAGGSQQASSQQQVEEPAVVTPAPAPAPVAPAPAPAPKMAGNCHTHPANSMTRSIRHCHPNPGGTHRYGGQRRAVGGNRWGHTHPAVPNCTKSIRHTHKYQNARHTHRYSCKGMRPAAAPARPQVDVYALQRKLKAKGYYRGPIDGVVGPSTRDALQRFMKR